MTLSELLQQNTLELTELVESVPDEIFNIKPGPEVWSVGEILEHLVRSEFGTSRLFMGETTKEADRDSDQKIREMENGFLDRTNKYRSFGVVNPTEGDKDKVELLQKFSSAREKVMELIQIQDPDEVCLAFEHPLFGYLSRREWIHFNVVHAQRHMMQMKELLTSIRD